METKRLIIRPFLDQDAEQMTPIFADPLVMSLVEDGHTYDGLETSERVRLWAHQFEHHGFGLFALVYKANNEVIGFTGLVQQVIDCQDCVELEYRLARSYWGQGLASEAVRAVMVHAFQKLQLRNVISIIREENVRSLKIAERCGMHKEKETLFHGKPSVIYQLDNPIF